MCTCVNNSIQDSTQCCNTSTNTMMVFFTNMKILDIVSTYETIFLQSNIQHPSVSFFKLQIFDLNKTTKYKFCFQSKCSDSVIFNSIVFNVDLFLSYPMNACITKFRCHICCVHKYISSNIMICSNLLMLYIHGES